MKNDYILFIDSGIGGLSTLASTITLFRYNYIFYADNKHCPYGNRSKTEILEFLTNIIYNICQKFNVNFIVIACNTATAAAIDDLRAVFKEKIIIGTEPAVAFASKFGYKHVLALTTPLTSSLQRYKLLCGKQQTKIKTLAIKSLVDSIENYYFNQTLITKFKLLQLVAKICKYSHNFDCIVLGCTHYVFLKPFIKQLRNIKTLDGNQGISNNLINHLTNSVKEKTKKSTVKVILSMPNNILIKKYKKILGQTLANSKILC